MNPFSKNSVESFSDRPEFQGWLIDFAERLVNETEDASRALRAMNDSSLIGHVDAWGRAKWMRRLNIVDEGISSKAMTGESMTPEARQAVMDAYYEAIDRNPNDAGIPPQFQKGWRDGIGSVVVADGLQTDDISPQPHDYLADVVSIDSAQRRVEASFGAQQSQGAPFMGTESDAA